MTQFREDLRTVSELVYLLNSAAIRPHDTPYVLEEEHHLMLAAMIGVNMTSANVQNYAVYLSKMHMRYDLIAWSIAVKTDGKQDLFATPEFLTFAKRLKPEMAEITGIDPGWPNPPRKDYHAELLRRSAAYIKGE